MPLFIILICLPALFGLGLLAYVAFCPACRLDFTLKQEDIDSDLSPARSGNV